jgi:release factor glutamine methyltransferase
MPETVASLLKRARAGLKSVGIDTAELDARLLLQAATGLTHEDIVADPSATVGDAEVFEWHLARRLKREPVSRIVGEREFYGRAFAITRDVLDPRPDTETMIDALLSLIGGKGAPRILDLGTGSGAIAITLLAEIPRATALATDISPDALLVAMDNAVRHDVASRLDVQCADWFEGVDGRFDLIVSNPPYIKTREIESLPGDVRDFDPRRALDGGPDGLSAYRILGAGAAPRLSPNGVLSVEIGAEQAADVETIFFHNDFKVMRKVMDLGGRHRVLILSLR